MWILTVRRRSSDDHGFTLIELVVSVVILGIVSAALIGIVFQFFRTSGVTDARLGENVDQQLISAYWQSDVSSTGTRVFSFGAADPVPQVASVFVGSVPAGSCPIVGTPIVSLRWTDFPVGAAPTDAWAPVRITIVYAMSEPVDGQSRLTRYRCRGTALESSNPLALRLLASPSPVITCRKVTQTSEIDDAGCLGGAAISKVSLAFSIQDKSKARSKPYRATVTADRRQK